MATSIYLFPSNLFPLIAKKIFRFEILELSKDIPENESSLYFLSKLGI